MMRHFLILGAIISSTMTAPAQQTDTVIVSLGKTSQVIFTMEDRSDIELLRHYNFQELFDDILTRLEGNDTATVAREQQDAHERNDEEPDFGANEEDESDEDDWTEREYHRRGRIGATRQMTNIDFGINNYLDADSQFPDESQNHSVRPWGSWYVAINSLQRTRAGRNFFIEWGLGVSWYNFKFANDQITLAKNDQTEQVEFLTTLANPDYNYIKSKLRVTHLNFSLVPVLDFNDRNTRTRMWRGSDRAFRFGVGPYVGYRIGSKSKLVYEEEDGDKKKDKVRSSYYLNDFRYGVRVQFGYRSTDFFINYDLNDMFKSNHGPKLNAVSFGFIL